jgi:hypothetical protein
VVFPDCSNCAAISDPSVRPHPQTVASSTFCRHHSIGNSMSDLNPASCIALRVLTAVGRAYACTRIPVFAQSSITCWRLAVPWGPCAISEGRHGTRVAPVNSHLREGADEPLRSNVRSRSTPAVSELQRKERCAIAFARRSNRLGWRQADGLRARPSTNRATSDRRTLRGQTQTVQTEHPRLHGLALVPLRVGRHHSAHNRDSSGPRTRVRRRTPMAMHGCLPVYSWWWTDQLETAPATRSARH